MSIEELSYEKKFDSFLFKNQLSSSSYQDKLKPT